MTDRVDLIPMLKRHREILVELGHGEESKIIQHVDNVLKGLRETALRMGLIEIEPDVWTSPELAALSEALTQ
jgi:hypothetical protein